MSSEITFQTIGGIKMLRHMIILLLVLAVFGPSIRYYDRNKQLRFTYESLVIEIMQRIMWFLERQRNQ